MNEAASLHLRLIGREAGQRVWYKGFGPGEIAPQWDSANPPDLPESLARWESEGLSIAAVVNPGGNEAGQISLCNAVFYEHDDIDKETSRNMWRGLGLPEPTLQIDTGNKSIHSYWVFESPITAREWILLQADLAALAGSDPKIVKPEQPMRLAGFKHPKTGRTAAVVGQSGRRDYETVRASVPKSSCLPAAYGCLHQPGCPTVSHCRGVRIAEARRLLGDASPWEDPRLHRLLAEFAEENAHKILTSPAASSRNHDWEGGLLVHAAEVARNCLGVLDSPMYKHQRAGLDSDALLLSAWFHDAGKAKGTNTGGNPASAELIFSGFARRNGLPARLASIVSHCILGQGARREGGQASEAHILWWADQISSRGPV